MIDEKVDSYANGELDHAMEAMALLWECSRKNRDPAKENQNMAVSHLARLLSSVPSIN